MTVRESIENYIAAMMVGDVGFSITRLTTLRRWLSEEDWVQICLPFSYEIRRDDGMG